MKEPLSLDEKFISNIFAKYLKAKKILQKSVPFLQEKAEYYGQEIVDFNKLSNYHNHLQIVETILALLPKAEYTCLMREFLTEIKDNSNSASIWWKKYYSEPQYQKLRQRSINRFLYYFLI